MRVVLVAFIAALVSGCLDPACLAKDCSYYPSAVVAFADLSGAWDQALAQAALRGLGYRIATSTINVAATESSAREGVVATRSANESVSLEVQLYVQSVGHGMSRDDANTLLAAREREGEKHAEGVIATFANATGWTAKGPVTWSQHVAVT